MKFSSRDEAIDFVKRFWMAMPHSEMLTMPDENDKEAWADELTTGDRTKIIKGVLPADKGLWLVSISGNHQPLTREAELWLSNQGL